MRVLKPGYEGIRARVMSRNPYHSPPECPFNNAIPYITIIVDGWVWDGEERKENRIEVRGIDRE